MTSNSSSEDRLPGSGRNSFRGFFLGVGVGLLLLIGFFYLQRPDLPVAILVIVGGMGSLLLLIGLLCPAPKPLTSQEQQNRAIDEEETILAPGRPTSNGVGRIGAAFSTSPASRLVFLSHGLNLQNADVVIPLATIACVKRARTLGIIPNAFQVLTADGMRYRFTVFSPKGWIDAIQTACSSNQPAGKPGGNR